MPNEHDDDLRGFHGDWIVATYHAYHHVEIHGVYSNHGKPASDWDPTSNIRDMYKWQSYHAAKKFRDAHPGLAGYVILNLTKIKQQCRQVDSLR